jgi:hypothetical protein
MEGRETPIRTVAGSRLVVIPGYLRPMPVLSGNVRDAELVYWDNTRLYGSHLALPLPLHLE